VDRDSALVAPYEALLENNGVKKVFVVENQVARAREVSTGIDTTLFTEILSGLNEGETVVISPGQNLKDGSPVREVADLPQVKEGKK